MRYLIFTLALFFTAVQAETTFHVHKREFTLSTLFEFESGGKLIAHAIKRKYYLRTHYELFDEKGEYVGEAVHRLMPSAGLGWMYDWAADIDVYDRFGRLVGVIDGSVFTEATAKFNFYNGEKELLAAAYMDRGKDSFLMIDPFKPKHEIAELKRNNVKFQLDYWTVHIYDENVLSSSVLQAFAIFACDRQEHFLEDE